LSQYEGLFESVVQWWFWESHRPDITNEAESFHTDTDTTDNDSDYVISHMDFSPEDVLSFIISKLCVFVSLILVCLMSGALLVYSGVHLKYQELSKAIRDWFNEFKPRQNVVGKSYNFLSAGETITCMSNVGEDGSIDNDSVASMTSRKRSRYTIPSVMYDITAIGKA